MIDVYIFVAVVSLLAGMVVGVIRDLCRVEKDYYELSTKIAELEYKLSVISIIQGEINGKEENEKEED